MTDRPILFSAPMVRALLDGEKTQTRRQMVAKPYNKAGNVVDIDVASAAGIVVGFDGRSYVQFEHPLGGPLTAYVAPHNVGDRLWVKEAWRTGIAYDDLKPSELGGDEQLLYETDGSVARWTARDSEPGRYRSARFMPRWASRLTLCITDVRVERIQSISDADIWAECDIDRWAGDYLDRKHGRGGGTKFQSIRTAFAALWDSVNGAGAWEANSWVVALTFSLEKRNIDE